MENQPNRLNDQLKQVLRLRLSQKTSIFLVCLVIASVFWLLNAFSKTYTTVVQYPLAYDEMPEDQVITSSLPRFLFVEITGYGFDLLPYLNGSVDDTLQVGENDIRWPANGGDQAYFVTSGLFQGLVKRLKPGIKANRLLRDTVRFQVEDRVSFMVPVIPDLDVELAPQHLQDGKLKVNPPAVKISGPKSEVTRLLEIKTEPLRLKDVTSDINVVLGVVVPEGRYLSLSPGMVEVTLPIDRFTDASIDLPVTIENLPDSLTLKIIPDTVTLNYQVALGRFSEVIQDEFKVAVDFGELEEGRHRKLKVHLRESPEFVRIVDWKPSKVEYILKK